MSPRSLVTRALRDIRNFKPWTHVKQCSRFACNSHAIRALTETRQNIELYFTIMLLRWKYPRFRYQHAILRMKAGDTCVECWCMTKMNSTSTEKSLITMHALHLNNTVEIPIQTRYFPCAGTHGDPKNRLSRHAQSSTLHSVNMKYIYDIFAPFLALVGSKRCETCFRGAGSSPDHHPSGARQGRSAKKCMK